MKILSGICVTAALLMAGAATPSFATALAPGGTVVPNTVAFGGLNTVLGNTGITAYSYGSGADTGIYQSEVGTWSGNPFGASDMTFVIAVEVTAGDIQHISDSNFDNGLWLVDVEQALGNSPGIPATDATFNFGVVEFDFPGQGGAILPGDFSYILIINTNAPTFTAGTIGLIDGGGTTVAGFMPAATPEPSTLSLLGTGLLAAGAGLRRRMLRK
jgi:hypothetical protein